MRPGSRHWSSRASAHARRCSSRASRSPPSRGWPARRASSVADPRPAPTPEARSRPCERHGPDLAEVRGQHHAVRALVIAAAGGHNCLLSGPPGTGKTMLAQRVPSILPQLNRPEAIEVTRIHSIAGGLEGELARTRPFRAPHHSITTAGLIGGARGLRRRGRARAPRGAVPGRALRVLAANARGAAPAARGRAGGDRQSQPLLPYIRRGSCSSPRPTRARADTAASRRGAACSEADLARHRRRLSGPLLDRIDVQVQLEHEGEAGPERVAVHELAAGARARR